MLNFHGVSAEKCLDVMIENELEDRTSAQCAFLFVVSQDDEVLICQVLSDQVLHEEIRFPVKDNSFSTALLLKRPISLTDIQECHKGDVNQLLGFTVKSLLCIPICDRNDHISFLSCLVNKKQSESAEEAANKILQFIEKEEEVENGDDLNELYGNEVDDNIDEYAVLDTSSNICVSSVYAGKSVAEDASYVLSGTEEIVKYLHEKLEKAHFIELDQEIVLKCFQHTAPSLSKALAYEKEKRLRIQCQSLLTVAKNLFTHLDDVTLLLKEIMQEARNLTKAERCSLFLIDKESKELVAKVFDGDLPDDGTQIEAEVRIPCNQGIAGRVFMTGTLCNIKDAYADPLFYKGVDISTGFKTRQLIVLCVIGVAELCNKIKGLSFTTFDEEMATAFSIYCGISIMHVSDNHSFLNICASQIFFKK
ncbi:cGMP-dependent 3',5'-cyclic phosphodiesterase [Nymphon striatum]|nr:cGMP-dependent 3',5'-cyclic phosphodiesterase [Nymphon striatum]